MLALHRHPAGCPEGRLALGVRRRDILAHFFEILICHQRSFSRNFRMLAGLARASPPPRTRCDGSSASESGIARSSASFPVSRPHPRLLPLCPASFAVLERCSRVPPSAASDPAGLHLISSPQRLPESSVRPICS